MELNYSAMYRNKLIEPGEYMAQVVSVNAVEKDDGTKVHEVEILLDNNESQYDGTRLLAILHPTTKGQRFVDAFMESYRVNETTVQQAVGRWAAVYVYEGLYKGSAYGAVKFHLQPAAARAKATELEGIVSAKKCPLPVERRSSDRTAPPASP